MEVLVFGAGALGTILAAHLADAGHAVTVLTRGKRAAQLRDGGLRVTGCSPREASCRIETDPAAIDRSELLLVALKSNDTAAALAPLRHLQVEAALSVQNGVMKDDILLACFGAGPVLGAMADFSGEMLEDGSVLFTRNVMLHIGELAGGHSERATAIAAVITDAGINCRAAADILSVEWSKFVGWIGWVAASVIGRRPTWEWLSDPDMGAMLIALTREAAQLAQRRGIALRDESPLFAASLVGGSDAAALARLAAMGEDMQHNAPDHRMSSLQDLERGAPLELAETFGFVLNEAEREGLDMPTVRCVYGQLRGIDRMNRR